MDSTTFFNEQQQAAVTLIQSDLRYIYTILAYNKNIYSNYPVMMLPFLGTIIDGAEDWIKAYNNSHRNKLNIPLFTSEEQQYYETLRASIKMWGYSYRDIRNMIAQKYEESELYFSNLCKPIAKKFKLYDIYGADIANGKYCGNTILCSCYVPQYHYREIDGELLKRLSCIGGKYIAIFGAAEAYSIDKTMRFSYIDYGGFRKSPIGNKFNDKFLLFSLLCQINFVLICVDKFILDECPTKLRFAYLLYFYIAQFLGEINFRLNTEFAMDESFISELFRNAMAHYKIGIALRREEIIKADMLFGLTQKYFNRDYFELKDIIYKELDTLAMQISSYLKITEVHYA